MQQEQTSQTVVSMPQFFRSLQNKKLSRFQKTTLCIGFQRKENIQSLAKNKRSNQQNHQKIIKIFKLNQNSFKEWIIGSTKLYQSKKDNQNFIYYPLDEIDQRKLQQIDKYKHMIQKQFLFKTLLEGTQKLRMAFIFSEQKISETIQIYQFTSSMIQQAYKRYGITNQMYEKIYIYLKVQMNEQVSSSLLSDLNLSQKQCIKLNIYLIPQNEQCLYQPHINNDSIQLQKILKNDQIQEKYFENQKFQEIFYDRKHNQYNKDQKNDIITANQIYAEVVKIVHVVLENMTQKLIKIQKNISQNTYQDERLRIGYAQFLHHILNESIPQLCGFIQKYPIIKSIPVRIANQMCQRQILQKIILKLSELQPYFTQILPNYKKEQNLKILNNYMNYYEYFCKTNESTYEKIFQLKNKLVELKDQNQNIIEVAKKIDTKNIDENLIVQVKNNKYKVLPRKGRQITIKYLENYLTQIVNIQNILNQNTHLVKADLELKKKKYQIMQIKAKIYELMAILQPLKSTQRQTNFKNALKQHLKIYKDPILTITKYKPNVPSYYSYKTYTYWTLTSISDILTNLQQIYLSILINKQLNQTLKLYNLTLQFRSQFSDQDQKLFIFYSQMIEYFKQRCQFQKVHELFEQMINRCQNFEQKQFYKRQYNNFKQWQLSKENQQKEQYIKDIQQEKTEFKLEEQLLNKIQEIANQ